MINLIAKYNLKIFLNVTWLIFRHESVMSSELRHYNPVNDVIAYKRHNVEMSTKTKFL